MTKLYFVRHGESTANLVSQFAGSFDTPLTEKGQAQAKATAEFLDTVSFSFIYASDLTRAYDTGCAVAQRQGVPIIPSEQLREIFAGEWEGKLYSQLELEYPKSYQTWKTHIGLAHCPRGESVAQLQERIGAFIDEIVRKHPGESICIATHATPIRVMECIWTQTPLENMHTIPWVSNASVTVAEYDECGVGRLVERDIHHHLGDLSTKLAKNV